MKTADIIASLSLVVAVVATGFAALSWYEAHSSGADATALAEAAKKQADAAQAQVNLLSQQLRLGAIQNRPVMKIGNLGFFDDDIRKLPVQLGFWLENVGATTAKHLTLDITYGYADSEAGPLTQIITTDHFTTQEVVLHDKFELGGRTSKLPRPNDQQMQAIAQKKLFLVALVTYKFSNELNLDGLSASPTEEHNLCYEFVPGAGNSIALCPMGAFGQSK
jgi:hypothetical protein